MDNYFGIEIIPENDKVRTQVLARYKILGTPPERAFDNVARLAAQIFQVPIALVSLVGGEDVFFKANIGMEKVKSSPRGTSLCSLAILRSEVTVFEDARVEPCLLANPLVAGSFGLQFYAGAPLVTHDGYPIGTLCIIDKTVRTFTEKDRVVLKGLARIVMDEMELRLAAIEEGEKQQSVFDRLIESEIKASYLVAGAPVAIGVLSGRELVIETANDKILEVWGKSKDIIGMRLQQALPEIREQPFLQTLDNVFTSGEPFYGKELKAHLERNGAMEEVYFNFVYQPIGGSLGSTVSIMIVATDVTEQVNARKELEKAQDILQLAMASSDMGTWRADLDTDSLSVSAQGQLIHGLPAGTALTLSQSLQMILPEHRERISDAIRKAVEDRASFQQEYMIQPMDEGSKPRWLSSTGKAYYDEQNKPLYITGTIIDITEQKQDEQRKNDFIAMVSHELKTPLTSMNGYLQMLLSLVRKSGDKMSISTAEKASKQIGKMTSMVNGFLNVSRLEAGKIYIDKQRFDMAELLKEAGEESLATISTHQVIFAPVETTFVDADRDKIGQVITNLISNAVKYSPPEVQLKLPAPLMVRQPR